MKRPVNTQMPATPIPSSQGSAGRAKLVTNFGDMGATVPKRLSVEKPGPLTAPSAQGPTRKGSK